MRTRPIRTDYYRSSKRVKSTFSSWANNAVGNAVKHMRSQRYDSSHCEVYDTVTGELHAVLRFYRGRNRTEIVYKQRSREEEFPYAERNPTTE